MNYNIIIPTLNEEKFLPKLLGQISDTRLKEKYKYKIIISDGGSSDNTVKIAEHAGCCVIKNEKKPFQTIGQGRNLGAKYIDSDYLIFFNADVILDHPETFFDEVESILKTEVYVAVGGHVKIYPEEEILVDKLFHGFYNLYFTILIFFGLGMARGECLIIKREIFEKLSGFNEKLVAGEDFDLIRRAKKIGKVIYSKNLLVYESPRRFRKFGYIKITFKWFLNSVSILINNKSISHSWEEVR